MSGKHRGIEKRYEGMTGGDGVLLAERTEGIAAVAHVLARVPHLPAGVRFCQPGLQGFRGLR
jgi:Ni,Fe-hydrogenase III large subunit